jgi:hypothetical protein
MSQLQNFQIWGYGSLNSFDNISAILWQSVILLEATRVLGKVTDLPQVRQVHNIRLYHIHLVMIRNLPHDFIGDIVLIVQIDVKSYSHMSMVMMALSLNFILV